MAELKEKILHDDDKYRPEYAVAWGCLMEFIVFFIIGLFFLCSCASHKQMSEVTHSTTDSTFTHTVEVKSSAYTQKDTTSNIVREEIVTTDDLDEIITEHSVITTDSNGTTTTTTDRTIKRRQSSTSNQKREQNEQKQSETLQSNEDVNLYLQSVISKQYSDSISQISSINENDGDNRPWYIRLSDMLKYIVIGGFIASIAYMTYKYISCK